jgi:hypothetical protein
MKEVEASGACSSNGEMRNALTFSSENLKGRNNLGDQGVDGMILLKTYFKEIGCVAVDWICLV